MKPELLAGIKDIMAVSGVSERTAKRRIAKIREQHKHVDLWRYCAWFEENRHTAREYMLSKRFDLLHAARSKRVELAPYAYEIRTWEEGYLTSGEVRKILFHEMVLLDTDGKRLAGRVRYITLPLEYIECYQEFSLEPLEAFVERVLPVESKDHLMEFFGLMVMKRSRQRRLGFVVGFEVVDAQLNLVSQALRKELKNKKVIWFCKTEVMDEGQGRVMGFWEIKGTGHAISGVPGYDRRGKVDVWIET